MLIDQPIHPIRAGLIDSIPDPTNCHHWRWQITTFAIRRKDAVFANAVQRRFARYRNLCCADQADQDGRPAITS